MPFRTKIQPIHGNRLSEELAFPRAMRQEPKSRPKRLFEHQLSLKSFFGGGDPSLSRGSSGEFEPSSVCLRKMVQNYMEDPESEKQSRCSGRNLCNCFNGSGTVSSDDEEEESSGGFLQNVKNLILCANISERERKLVTKATEIVEKNDNDSRLKTVVDELVALGYDAAICKSRWEKSEKSLCPAGEYKYLDVMIGGERVLIDIDFKSKFEIARPTKTYKSISRTLPYIFVGQVDRLKKIVVVVSKAAKKSFKKKGLYVPPWRRAEYVLTKWLSPHVRADQNQGETSGDVEVEAYKVK